MSVSRARFGTPVPAELTGRLPHMTNTEPTAAYLRPARRWDEELVSNVRALPRPLDRLRLLREVVLPNPGYVLRLYGASGTKSVLLPVLYVHRVLHGLWKVMTGRK